MRFGMGNYHPNDPDKITNEQNIMTEYYQLVAVIEMLLHSGILNDLSIVDKDAIISAKKENVKRFQRLSEKLQIVKN